MSSSAIEKKIICRHSSHCTYSHRSARSKICFLEINCQTVRGIFFSYGVRDNHSLIFRSKQRASLVEFFLAIVRMYGGSYDSRFCYQFGERRDERRSGETEWGRGIGQSIFMFIIYIYMYEYVYRTLRSYRCLIDLRDSHVQFRRTRLLKFHIGERSFL